MININDVVVPTKGTGKYLSVKVLSFDLTPENGISLYWAIHAEKVVTETVDEVETQTITPAEMLLEGNLNYPQSEYDNWGTDDSVVTTWVMNELGVTELVAE